MRDLDIEGAKTRADEGQAIAARATRGPLRAEAVEDGAGAEAGFQLAIEVWR